MSYSLENKSNNIVGPNREYIMVDGKPVTGKYGTDGSVIEGSNGEKYPVGMPKVTKPPGNQGRVGHDDDPHATMQAALGAKTQSKIPLSFFDNKPYTNGGATFVFNAIKHGVLNDFESFMVELAERHGISVQNTDMMSGLLRGMVADLYANGASDKRDMTGVIKVDNTVVYERIWFKEVANKYVGSNIRRIARAAAPIIVRLLQIDRDVFHDLVSARAKEFSVSIEDAVYLFDGADMLPTTPSHLKRLNLESRMIRLSRADLTSNTNTELVEMKYGEAYEDSVKRAETKEMSRG